MCVYIFVWESFLFQKFRLKELKIMQEGRQKNFGNLVNKENSTIKLFFPLHYVLSKHHCRKQPDHRWFWPYFSSVTSWKTKEQRMMKLRSFPWTTEIFLGGLVVVPSTYLHSVLYLVFLRWLRVVSIFWLWILSSNTSLSAFVSSWLTLWSSKKHFQIAIKLQETSVGHMLI